MLKYKLYTVYVSSHGTLESRYRLCISGDLSRPTCVSLPRLAVYHILYSLTRRVMGGGGGVRVCRGSSRLVRFRKVS